MDTLEHCKTFDRSVDDTDSGGSPQGLAGATASPSFTLNSILDVIHQ